METERFRQEVSAVLSVNRSPLSQPSFNTVEYVQANVLAVAANGETVSRHRIRPLQSVTREVGFFSVRFRAQYLNGNARRVLYLARPTTDPPPPRNQRYQNRCRKRRRKRIHGNARARARHNASQDNVVAGARSLATSTGVERLWKARTIRLRRALFPPLTHARIRKSELESRARSRAILLRRPHRKGKSCTPRRKPPFSTLSSSHPPRVVTVRGGSRTCPADRGKAAREFAAQ